MIRAIIMCLVISVVPMNAFAKARVLLIESYYSDFFWNVDIRKGLLSVLKDKVELLTFEMDTKRIPQSEYQARADEAWEYYQQTNPDIVLLADDNALSLLGKRFQTTKTPVVFLGINQNPRKYIALHKNITGVVEKLLFKRMIKILADLTPKHKKALILINKSTTANVVIERAFPERHDIDIGPTNVDISMTSSYEDWKKEVLATKSKGYDYLILGLHYRIFDGQKHVPSDEVLKWSSQNSPVPLFSFWGVSVGKGKAAGGLIMTGEIQGSAAGKIVNEILAGRDITEIPPVTPDYGKLVFSRHELERWGIVLPLGFKQRSMFVE